jgi:hypothetical protein
VRWLRRIHVPRILAVISVVALAFAASPLSAWLSPGKWPIWRRACRPTSATLKPRSTPSATRLPGGALFDRATNMIRDLGRKIEEQAEDAEAVQENRAHRPRPQSLSRFRSRT